MPEKNIENQSIFDEAVKFIGLLSYGPPSRYHMAQLSDSCKELKMVY